jgi:hypothetical protein
VAASGHGGGLGGGTDTDHLGGGEVRGRGGELPGRPAVGGGAVGGDQDDLGVCGDGVCGDPPQVPGVQVVGVGDHDQRRGPQLPAAGVEVAQHALGGSGIAGAVVAGCSRGALGAADDQRRLPLGAGGIGERGEHRGGGAAIDPAGKVIREFKGTTGGREHYANFFDAMRSRDPQHLNADVVVGHDSTNWSHVINAAWRSAGTAGFIPGGTLAGGESSAALERLLLDHVAAYGAAIPADALTLSQRLEIDATREMFVGPGAEEANAFLGPREFRTPYVLEPVPGPSGEFTPPAATVRSKP